MSTERDTVHFLPRFVWAVLIVCASPIGGLVYLVASPRFPGPCSDAVAQRRNERWEETQSSRFTWSRWSSL
jgi:hypothetical protein